MIYSKVFSCLFVIDLVDSFIRILPHLTNSFTCSSKMTCKDMCSVNTKHCATLFSLVFPSSVQAITTMDKSLISSRHWIWSFYGLSVGCVNSGLNRIDSVPGPISVAMTFLDLVTESDEIMSTHAQQVSNLYPRAFDYGHALFSTLYIPLVIRHFGPLDSVLHISAR